jgi:hypothetical protein
VKPYSPPQNKTTFIHHINPNGCVMYWSKIFSHQVFTRLLFIKNLLVMFFSKKKPQRTVVTFSGGMGAQIISAAIYYYLKDTGNSVFADLSYFKNKVSLAVEGKIGEVSYWDWQLDIFGISPSSFEVSSESQDYQPQMLKDGVEKLALGLEALRVPSVKSRFAIPIDIETSALQCLEVKRKYVCVHIRRGDYINVASHLISSDDLVQIAIKFKNLVDSIVILSDSKIDDEVQKLMLENFSYVQTSDQLDARTSHVVMRNAAILICSNSQFSLTAALLNAKCVPIIPIEWYGSSDRALQEVIRKTCRFQII